MKGVNSVETSKSGTSKNFFLMDSPRPSRNEDKGNIRYKFSKNFKKGDAEKTLKKPMGLQGFLEISPPHGRTLEIDD